MREPMIESKNLLNDNQMDQSALKINNFKKQIKRREVFLKRDEVEKKIFEVFPVLNDESKFHDFFSSYDFHENEAFMLHFWKDVLEYIVVYINNNFSINYGQLISLTRFKYIEPMGLPKIITKLINDGEFILASDLKSDEYYRKNFPKLYPKETWGQYFKKTIVNSIWSGSNNDNKVISNDDLIINKKTFLVIFYILS